MPLCSSYGTGGALPAIDAFVLDTFDRSAPNGTGHTKLGGNYAPVFGPTAAAKAQGYPITLHLDSANHTHVDEFSTSNALALASKDGKQTLVVPESPSILRSVTKLSVCDLARRMGWTVERRPLAFDEVKKGDFVEFMAAGTAAVSPLASLLRPPSTELTCPFHLGHHARPQHQLQHQAAGAQGDAVDQRPGGRRAGVARVRGCAGQRGEAHCLWRRQDCGRKRRGALEGA